MLDLKMIKQYNFKNLKGYIILLFSFLILMIIKELEVWAIKKTIKINHEIMETQ